MQAIKLPTDKIQPLSSLHVVGFINNMGLECSSFNEFRVFVAETWILCCNDDCFGGPLGELGSVQKYLSDKIIPTPLKQPQISPP